MALTPSANRLKPGTHAPNFQLKGIDGKSHSLSSLKGSRGTLVVFMCNHCPFVIQKVEALRDLQKYAHENGIGMVGINSNDTLKYPDDSFEKMKEFAAHNGLEFPYVIDESQEVAKAFGATCTPDAFLLDKEGKVFFHGRLNDQMQLGERVSERTMRDAIDALLAGSKPKKDFEPSVGCNIKWKQ